MLDSNRPDLTKKRFRLPTGWPWWLAWSALLILVLTSYLREVNWRTNPTTAVANNVVVSSSARFGNLPFPFQKVGANLPSSAAEEIVKTKLSQFAQSRRHLARGLADRNRQQVPLAVERLFTAIQMGDWDEIDAAFKSLDSKRKKASSGDEEGAAVLALWGPILESYGVAEAAHLWPAAKLLDYGHSILDSLRPGMAYVGGTDSGRFIPTLLNETSDGERHIVITQNGLADATYADYVRFQYGDRFDLFTPEESAKAFQEYVAAAQKRLEHDLKYPDEPKQVLPGEELNSHDGRLEVSGQTAVMAINEKLLQTILKKNPDLSFAVEESFPMKNTYPGGALLGPIMEIRAQDAEESFTEDNSAQSVEYWRTTTQLLLNDPDASASPDVMKTYSHMANAQANLLANHDATAAAEQTYRIAAQLWPGNPETASSLSDLLARTGRAEEGQRLLQTFLTEYPNEQAAIEAMSAWHIIGNQSSQEIPKKP